MEYEKKQKERMFTASIARKKRQEVTAADQEYGADAVSSTKNAGARRTATSIRIFPPSYRAGPKGVIMNRGDHFSSAPSIFSRLRRPCHARHVTAHRKI